MRKKQFLALLCALVLLLAGCTVREDKGVQNIVETLGENSIRLTYDSLHGKKDYSLTLEGDAAISVDVKSQKGKIKLSIFENGQEPVYTGTISEDFSFIVYAGAGSYTVRLEGEKHAGGVSLNWTNR